MSTTPSTILVTGATGSIGRALVDRLTRPDVAAAAADAAHPYAVRVLARRPDQVTAFAERGIDAALGSLDDVASLERAMQGCDQVFLLAPVTPDMEQLARQGIDAARSAGVRHVVKVSASDARTDSPVPWAAAHARTDEHLRISGLEHTVLRATAFMSNLLDLSPALRRGLLPGTSGAGATTWIAPEDVAVAAATVLTTPSRQGGAREAGAMHLLTATPSLSFPEVAEQLTPALGRRVRYVHLPRPFMYLATRLGGSSHWEARGLVRQFADVVRHTADGVGDYSTALAELMGEEPTSIADYARAHLADLAPTHARRRSTLVPGTSSH
ncbi:SDR family oxidoreductase [Nocardioides marinquilinus]|uniref:SDR family oxidoreductase n=1 Tax=Nocardioides marinquilinus TaxID=1210400 RepID=A0ABP9PPX9_9ACTN